MRIGDTMRAWVTVAVTLVFTAVVVRLTGGLPDPGPMRDLTIAGGTAVLMSFREVVSFWFSSSDGSKTKEAEADLNVNAGR